MPFALPMVHNSAEAARIKIPRLEDSTLALQFEMADRLKAKAGNDAIFKMVDIQSPMDITALLWDKNDLYIAILEEPEAVKELAEKVMELLSSFLDTWFQRYGAEFISHFPNYYMPKGITLSEDEVGIVSKQMFENFYLPELTYLSNRYGGLGMHCCADSRHQWDGFKKIPSLKMINFKGQSRDRLDQYEYFKDHVAQWHSWNGPEKPWEWLTLLPSGVHCSVEIDAGSREEALEYCERLSEICG
jgi:hypothetical protein